MKLKKINIFKYKLIKLQFLKSKTDKNNLDKFELELKKIILIFSNYHINNKKVFFVGAPKLIAKNLKKTKHLILTESHWVKGLLTNQMNVFKSIKKHVDFFIKTRTKTRQFKKLFLVKKQPNLIVLFNANLETVVFKETKRLQIPVISLNSDISIKNTIFYKIFANHELLDINVCNAFLLLLNSILKKF